VFYCMGGHLRFLVNECGYAREDVELMRRGEPAEGMDDREHALVLLVRCAALDGGEVSQRDIGRAQVHGWDDDQIVEALSAAAQAFFTNTFAQATPPGG